MLYDTRSAVDLPLPFFLRASIVTAPMAPALATCVPPHGHGRPPTVTMRVLLRRPELSTGAGTVVMSEFYVNDVLAHPYTYKTAAREALSLGALSVPAQQQGRDGGAVAGAAVGGVRAWRMTLPYQ